MLAGTLAGIVAPRIGLAQPAAIAVAIVVGLLTVGVLAAYHYRAVVEPRGRRAARLAEAPPGSVGNSGS